ncbi:nucleoid occlusion protein [Lacticaseibacillus saniviri]|uniref:Nucleoid occlusion protein n=1 Tax=Lacticaseibacillus saniviri JCM 17471 = DSM 24301 TaxID=1293598 RepID=A0A0R2MW03_9LACO|nr:nucleoid occlusion protein [Lacticaseibacillus saniviri]KRO16395.1 nucleoid occlusion protein [Lacticaseibacillus saniviri JCM 17471 = DSM 24301]MCG4281063.1 nucleoid occlusion protein [Lacticaseibacillus saniviri]
MALFFNRKKTTPESKAVVQEVPLTAIVPNRFQPRKVFAKDAIDDLAQTIKEHGLLQPIILREYETGKYEIIAGERRFRAMQSLDFDKAPAIVQTMDDHESASMALIENLQREGLTAIEEARAYTELMKLNELTQDALAQQMGKSQSFVANKLRLLKLSDPAQNAILNHEITERHGRELLHLDDYHQQLMLHRIMAEGLTVKETAAEVQAIINPEPEPEPQPAETSETTETKKPAKKRQTKRKKRAVSNDPRLALNTIKASLKLVKDSGMAVASEEEETETSYRITIEIPKK